VRQAALGTTTSQNHNTALQTLGSTQATATAQYTHSTLLKSSNLPMAAARRRQGQQLYAWHGTPSRRPQAAPPFPLTLASEATQPQPPAFHSASTTSTTAVATGGVAMRVQYKQGQTAKER